MNMNMNNLDDINYKLKEIKESKAGIKSSAREKSISVDNYRLSAQNNSSVNIRDKELNKFEMIRKMEAKLNGPELDGKLNNRMTSNLSSMGVSSGPGQAKEPVIETKSSGLHKRIVKMNQQLTQEKPIEEIKSARTRFQTLRTNMNTNQELTSIPNQIFFSANDNPNINNISYPFPEATSTFSNNNLAEAMKSSVDVKSRVDEELSHFSKDLNWNPRSKLTLKEKETVKDSNTATFKSNLDKMFKSENPFIKNLNSTNRLSSNNLSHVNLASADKTSVIPQTVPASTSGAYPGYTNYSNIGKSSAALNLDEVKLLSNKLRFMSDNSIKTMDAVLISELKSLSGVLLGVLDKTAV
mmetsp:Transcript_27186/g.28249  ORF Transcript_27186/g.28249 Transcript_27186/m.28249 type:complete len:354 (+) Transcript_27186:1-1062(+)